ncbi:MAG: type II secretion system protein GspE [Gammaproteobacteria bacterium]|nr:MAG: type II secretion system protein GspE [Gammaproteobacteria bacterium]
MQTISEVADRDSYQQLVDLLLEEHLITLADVDKAGRLAGRSDANSFPHLLLDLGMVSEADLAEQLARVSEHEWIAGKDIPETPQLNGVSPRFLKEFSVAGLFFDEHRAGIVVVDPFDDYIRDSLSLELDREIIVHVGTRSDIEKALSNQYAVDDSAEGADEVIDDDEDIERLRDIASEAPVIRYVAVLFQRAVEARASDIHVESAEKGLKLRLRIDGVLKEIAAPPGGTAIGVISRIKLLAKMNIAERRLPQDGRIRHQVNGKEFDMRISTAPTTHGEGVVIRLLDVEQVNLDFETLGFSGPALERFLEILSLPHGVILITGPTGSGKTTTLYTALTRLNDTKSKIITVEDPVEYEVPGINQIQVKPEIGLDFSSLLRSIVRQDPDIIMIGEMRDIETVNIAIQSALTGHLVLSTLHTNDAASGINRLLDMGVDDFLLASTVTGILAQRLVRKLCSHCKKSYQPSAEVISELGLARVMSQQEATFYFAAGCDQCEGTGYRGRLAVLEFLVVTEKIKQLVMSRALSSEITECAVGDGMASMFDDGIEKAAAGLTTLEEVVRLTKRG